MKALCISMAVCLTAGVACSPEEQGPQADGMKVKVGEEQWSSDRIYVVRDKKALTITILKSAETFTRIDIFVKDATVQTHYLSGMTETNFPDSYVNLIPEVYAVSNPAYRSTDIDDFVGEVNIIEFDTITGIVSGTFFSRVKRFFPSSETIQIREGSFRKTGIEIGKFANSFGATGSITGRFNGVEFRATSTGGSSNVEGPYAGKLWFSAYSPRKDAIPESYDIHMFVPTSITPGYYRLDTLGSTCSIWFRGFADDYESSSGVLIVSSHDTIKRSIAGSFEFVGQPLSGTQPPFKFYSGKFLLFYSP